MGIRLKVIIFLSGIFLLSFYIWIVFCLKDNTLQNSLLPLSVELIGSFLLAFIVFLLGAKVQKSWREKTHKSELENELDLLKVQIQRVFKRRQGSLNFRNITPTFYFDKSWINPLYQLLTENNRRWESILLDYKNSYKVTSTIKKLLDFLDNMENTLILAEKIDTHIKEIILAPTLAAAKDSSYLVDTQNADIDQAINLLVYRAYLIDAEETETIFGVALVHKITNVTNKVQHARIEIQKILTKDKQLKKLVGELKTNRNKLSKQVTAINNIVS